MIRGIIKRFSGFRSSYRCLSTDQNAGSPGDLFEPSHDVAPPPIPEYQARSGESDEIKRARLLYQSRKRGMLENGILISCFADKYLSKLSAEQLDTFDNLINKPSNDWDIFHWITGKEPTPLEYDSDVMNLMKEYVQNKDREQRLRQPDLY